MAPPAVSALLFQSGALFQSRTHTQTPSTNPPSDTKHSFLWTSFYMKIKNMHVYGGHSSSHIWPLKSVQHIDHRGAGWSADLCITRVCVHHVSEGWIRAQMALFFIPRVRLSSPTAKFNVCLSASLHSLSVCVAPSLTPTRCHHRLKRHSPQQCRGCWADCSNQTLQGRAY